MTDTAAQDNRKLIDFWDKAYALPENEQAGGDLNEAEDWRMLAPSEKLLEAAGSLAGRKKVLDYGCGNAWAGIIAARSGCDDVTAVDAAAGAVEAARFQAALFGAKERMHIFLIEPDWLKTVPANTYDGFICSNVLDIVPPETAENILRESARIVTGDADVIIGMNYYLSAEAAAARGMELKDGKMLYIDSVLRLVSRTDEEWEQVFLPYYTIERLEYFAWPGEKTETRRLFHLRKRTG